MTSSHPTPAPCQWFVRPSNALDRRTAAKLAWLFVGAILAVTRTSPSNAEIQAAIDRLLRLAA